MEPKQELNELQQQNECIPQKSLDKLDQQKSLLTEKKQYERLLQKYLKINSPVLDTKHCTCTHRNGCLTQLFDLSVRGFAAGYLTKTALGVVMFLLKKPSYLIKKPHLLLMVLFQKSNFDFAMFPCVYNLVLQFMTCSLKHFRDGRVEEQGDSQNKSKKIQKVVDPFIAGFCAGFFALMTKPKSGRAIWGLFLITRAFECMYNSLINKGYIPYTKYNWVLIFSLMWINQGYNIAMEPGNCPPSFGKFISQQMNQEVGDHTLNIAWIKKKNNELKSYYGDFVPAYDPKKYLAKPIQNSSEIFGFKSYEKSYNQIHFPSSKK